MGAHRRGPWSQQEDLCLLQLVHQDGASNWVRISHDIGTRSPKQCRERFHQNLKPTLNHDPITPEEGEQIEKMVQEMGKRWAEIARRLKGRSDNAVKNWWNGGQNRRRRGADHRRTDSDNMHTYGMDYQHMADRRTSLPVLDTRTQYPNPSYYAPPSQPRYPLPSTMPYPPTYSGGLRPTPLSIHAAPQPGRSGQAFDTPMPSPSASVMSGEGAPPSLITDNGSESRSPNYTNSPNELYALPPTIGARDERRRSSVRYLPKSGFATDVDDFKKVHLAPISQNSSEAPKAPLALGPMQLPSPQNMVRGAPAEQYPQLPSSRALIGGQSEKPAFREADYASWHTAAEPKKMALSSILG